MPPQSAGILLYRIRNDVPEVLLAHPGGPFWAKKDAGVWSIPKGIPENGESLPEAAKREFEEELGAPAPDGDLSGLPAVKAKSGKVVSVFALHGDFDETHVSSNTFRAEYPYKSGHWQDFPEVDRAQWFAPDEARRRILPYQAPLLDALDDLLNKPR